RALCKDVKRNDLIGSIATIAFSPYASLALFRWAHMEHHRFTNAEDDPDEWCHGSAWTLPLRWLTIDVNYLVRALRSTNPAVKKVLKEMVPQLVIVAVLFVLCIAAGYGWELVFLVLIPTRITLLLNGFMFFWLPHAHHKPKQSENLTLATTVRVGSEWLLTPLLQCQNYHLIHHLWPTTPFYNNVKVWKLLEPELRQRDLAIQHNFSIEPEIVLAPANATPDNAIKG
ncbi:MAG TPA: fatty acid desaturase, partial [Pseudomonadales bacterium]|nr:fatty acid desaturase [Pseudomonadales bacterium]